MTTEGGSSRVCVKGLPKHLTEERMRGIFGEVGQITDVKIVRTAEGKSRLFGFVGYASEAEAAAAVARLHNTFVDTSRIQVELARGVGDATLPRPWSKYSEGSSRFQGKPGAATAAVPKEEQRNKRQRAQSAAAAEKERERDQRFAEFLKVAMPGKSQERRTMPWENVGEEEPEAEQIGAAAGEEMDDAAWLRAKQGLGKEEEGEQGKANKKKKREAEAGADEEGAEEAEYLRSSLAVRHAEQAAKIAETRRLFVRNLPPGIDEPALRRHCARFGTVTECLLPLSAKTKLPKGFALVSFSAPHEALQAFAGLDGQILAGRLLHALAAEAPRGGAEESAGKEKGSSSFKRQRELQLREQGRHSGSALFVRADAAAALTAEKLGLRKAELLSAEAKGSVAVRAALAEAEVIADAKRFLEEHGVVPEVLANADRAAEKSDSTFLVKHLPAGTSAEKLEQLYAPFGDLGRVLVVPGGSLGLVEFQRASEAQKAYRRTAFSNVGGAPLYLQWAPMKLFSREFEFKARPQMESAGREAAAQGEEEEGEEGACTVFVKNLSFATTREELAAHVGSEGVRAVTIVSKNGQSLGYGFLEFANRAAAVKAMKQLQGFKLDGHALELMFSERQEAKGAQKKKKKKKDKRREAAVAVESSKLVVRNVPFEASKKELQELMGAYGALKSLRLPLKFDRSHRGYAFAEYQSKSEARKALEALESAHLYGRHLVVEYAKEEDEVAQAREKTAKKFKKAEQ